MAETCNFLIVKFFALFTHDAQLVVNLFTLSTYVIDHGHRVDGVALFSHRLSAGSGVQPAVFVSAVSF